MDNSFDREIDNYTDKELLEIIGLNNVDNKNIIKKKIDSIINRLHKKDDKNFLEFFENMKNRLLNENNQIKNPKNQSDIWLQNQFLPPANENVKDRLTNRSDQIELLNNPHIPIMNRKNLGIQNNIPLEVAQDTLNPNLKQLESRIIMIDSKDRPDIVPFSNDPNDITSPTNFTCNLFTKLINVISMRVTSIFIPGTFNIIDKFKGNNFFEISDQRVIIPDGNYNLTQLLTILNNNPVVRNYDLSFQKVNSEGVTSEMGDRLKIHYNGNDSIIIKFFNRFYDSSNCLQSPIYYTTCLAYNLGFRYNVPRSDIDNDPNCNVKIPDNWRIRFTNSNRTYLAETVPNIIGPRFFNLCIDDFQNNQASSCYVNIQHIDNKLTLPDYINKLNNDGNSNNTTQNCITSNTGRVYKQFIPTLPRKLTQNQLYSANSILINQITPNNREQPLNNQDVLATINIPPDILHNSNITSITLNNISRDSTHVRKYYGPVNIERLKITLYDNNGFLVNLNNHDWNFTLQVEQLYQY